MYEVVCHFWSVAVTDLTSCLLNTLEKTCVTGSTQTPPPLPRCAICGFCDLMQERKINIFSALFHVLTLHCHLYTPFFFPLLFAISISAFITLTSHATPTIRHLQLRNPLHQCQSGQPHRWIQRHPVQKVHGSDRLSRRGRCVRGGAPEHHSMTLRHQLSQHACGWTPSLLPPSRPDGPLNNAHPNPEVEHICCRLVSYNYSLYRNGIFKKTYTQTNTKMPL